MKHNVSITMDTQLFREIENTHGREKRSTFIEHLIVIGLKAYKDKNEGNETKHCNKAVTVISPLNFSKTK